MATEKISNRIDAPRRRTAPATEEDRRLVIDMKAVGEQTAEIKKITDLSKETICRIIRKARKAGEIPPSPLETRLQTMRLHPELIPEVQ